MTDALKIHGPGRAGHYLCGTPLTVVRWGEVAEPGRDWREWTCRRCLTGMIRREVHVLKKHEARVDRAHRRIGRVIDQYDRAAMGATR